MSFYSVSQDGRVSQWFVRTTSLKYEDVLNFHAAEQTQDHVAPSSKTELEGNAMNTCLDSYYVVLYLIAHNILK